MISEPSSLATMDEFEGLEITEFDANELWELLYDEGETKVPMQAMELVGQKPNTGIGETHRGLDDIINNGNLKDFDWSHVLDETYEAYHDMDLGEWYGGACTEEMNEIYYMGDYSLIQSDEIGCIGLWQDSYNMGGISHLSSNGEMNTGLLKQPPLTPAADENKLSFPMLHALVF